MVAQVHEASRIGIVPTDAGLADASDGLVDRDPWWPRGRRAILAGVSA
jgi:hypothetical protein